MISQPEDGLPAAPRESQRQTKAPRRWVIGRTIEREVATDLLYDQLATKRSYGVLTIIDPFWRFSPAMEPLLTFRGPDIVNEIAPEPAGHGLPLSKCEAYNRVYEQSCGSS